MDRKKYLGKKTMILISLALMLISLWEACVRLDAMYAPLKMFFSMAFGEGISLSSAMQYFDWSIFEAPVWLVGCVLISLLSIALSRRPAGSALLLPLSLLMAAYGLTREGTFITDVWRLMQPALLLALSALALINLIAMPVRRRRAKRSTPPDAPRMTDAPRLRGSSRVHSPDNRSRRAG